MYVRGSLSLLFPLSLLCMAYAPTRGQDRLDGTWRGYWIRAGDSMLVSLAVKRDTSGSRFTATFAADRLRVTGIPFTEVQLRGCCDVSMTLRGDRTTAVFSGHLRGDSLTGTLQETTRDGRFAYARVRATDSPFEEQDVTFNSGSVTLAGTVLLPRTGNALSGVAFLHGSGAEGRWASRFLASQLASRGVAALIWDKRGVGASSGDWRRATIDDLVADGVAAVARLRQVSRIDSSRVGIHGHSQGGTLSPMVAVRSGDVAFVIGSAAAGIPTDSTELFSILNSVLPAATTAEDSADARAYTSALVAVAYHGAPRGRLDSLATELRTRRWFFPPPQPDNSYWSFSRDFGQFRALDWWPQVRVPVLLLYGGDDQRVPAAQSAERIAATLRRAGNADVTVRISPGADHTFRMRPGPSGWPVTAPNYIADLLGWVARR